jgi:TetR/AcrR family transcriptional regulator, cholesterol catabolism regulator
MGQDAAPADALSKSARTRSRILNAAAHVLSVKGYAGTRLSDVAEYAELQAPAIYYYFPSREDLIEEVMYAGIADMRRHLQVALDALPPETSPIDKIMAAVEAHLRHELELSDYASASIATRGRCPSACGRASSRKRLLTDGSGGACSMKHAQTVSSGAISTPGLPSCW